jgi:hypothetical protein
VPKGNLLSRYEENSRAEAPQDVESNKSEKWDKTKLRQTRGTTSRQTRTLLAPFGKVALPYKLVKQLTQ